MSKVTLDLTYTKSFILDHELKLIGAKATAALDLLKKGEGAGNDFLGWLELPANYDRDEFGRIKLAADKIRSNSEVVVVIGIGGSFLGAKAAIHALTPHFANEMNKKERGGPEVYFAGTNLSPAYHNDLLKVIGDRSFSIIMISKSGTTTEPAIAFRIFKKKLESKYGKSGSRERIFATTDKRRGALKNLADKEGYECFVVPDNVGGRFSVLTAVGLLPIAVAGINIDELMSGANVAAREAKERDPKYINYVSVRNTLYSKGKNIELLVHFEPALAFFVEWWKQLFGESEGKDQKGIFPASAGFTADLHSLGQYIQDGRRNLFETALLIGESNAEINISEEINDPDGLNYLTGKSMTWINRKAAEGTIMAHEAGGVPVLSFEIPVLDAYNLGYLFYFFEMSCAMSGYLLGVNPFDQPGVEAYKKNMFRLLGKPQ